MNPMMAGMNTGVGGPVGGGMPMMANGVPNTPMNNNSPEAQRLTFNTYIYDYLIKFGHYEHARRLVNDPKFEINTKANIKSSPGRRKDGELNGMDENGMDMDSKDDIPEDLPRPACGVDSPGNGFLFDWFFLFWDLYAAQRQKSQGSAAQQYLHQTQGMQRMSENARNQQVLPIQKAAMMANQNNFAAMRGMRNGMMNGDMTRAAMSKSLTPQQMQQFQQRQAMQQGQQQVQMQREQSEVDMNGHRPDSPADGDNVGSPSKRPRLGEQQFNGGMGPNGRGPGMQGVPPGMLLQGGLNPNNLNQGQLKAFNAQNGNAMQQRAMQGGMVNGMMNMGSASSPMMQPADPAFMNSMQLEIYNQRLAGQNMQGGPGGPQSGNHALQDYQMQLMLLEQQNKKRLMMARQEQDLVARNDGGPQLAGQVGMQGSGMSPSGSRSGNSPNPNDQLKRNQLGGLGTSPAAGDAMQGRASPSGMNFMNGVPQDFNTAMFINKDGMAGPGGPNMRGPTSMGNMDMSANARIQQQGRITGQFQGGQPMVQNMSQGQPQPMGTPGQRNEMPPPQAPATGSANAQRTQPSSPQSNQAPPTPSQANKPNPKGKKGKEGENRKRPTKKNSTANAPSTDPEPPATPTPAGPITPVHPNSFNTSGGKGPGAGMPPANVAPTSNPMAPNPQIPQPDMSQSMNIDIDPSFNLDFSTLENPDVLENFDFDSFLNTTQDDQFNFDPSMGGGDFSLTD